ncbi:helix-turn-helix domain-containing protein [Chitinophaga japonensis]|uniref:Helicase-like protein n=1 Tax=Chitinophaga japonensis TaxID=104662 RepID=A0A562T0F1_CHIJA|nr:helix-turn-helix domain-containing protein [Chitinophaga japonensis]TWI86952.1 helicase-like protein [Chitinophaga japonensis]
MPQPDSSNTMFQLAADFIQQTNRHIFLTGKAGTGKTTFLKYVKEHTAKNTVVIAPTGVAAINAGGVTMHSFFQLPFGPFIPGARRGFGEADDNSVDMHALFRNIRFNHDKKAMLRELELLIIDEVSMVRADSLDAIDTILRHFRNQPLLPFGGVQVLFIGDLFQLPPVVPDAEWQLLKEYYASIFFFDAKVLEQAPPLYVELKKIYRQNEATFIDLLNGIRSNSVTPEQLELLNSRYQPGFSGGDAPYIVLTTHNRRADEINAARLAAVPGPVHRFEGLIEGDFSDKALPTEQVLQLKPGAQVMFIKNDLAEVKRYYNGKIATVKAIEEDRIMVTLAGSEEDLQLEKEKWRNIRYTFNKAENRIEEEELGSFTQYPVRLAWAITIHKSQGLTFERAIIDAGSAFAPGQVYVALSRCTSLDGLVLHSRIHPSAIRNDEQVTAFAARENAANELQHLLDKEKRVFWANRLVQVFSWQKLLAALQEHAAWLAAKKLPDMEAAQALSRLLQENAAQQQQVAQKFRPQLRSILDTVVETDDIAPLQERLHKAIGYFTRSLYEELIKPLQEHKAAVKGARQRKYLAQLETLEATLWNKLQQVWQAAYGEQYFHEGLMDYTLQRSAPPAKPAKQKQEAGSSRRGSLELYLEGKSVTEIAGLRQLAASTIESHLAQCVGAGELELERFVPKEKVDRILPLVSELGLTATGPIKQRLGDIVTYAEIRAVQGYCRLAKE